MKNVWVDIELITKDIQTESISYSVEGTYDEENQTLTFTEAAPDEEMETCVSTLRLIDEDLQMIRENDEMKMECIYKVDAQTYGNYHIKEFDVNFPLNIFTDDLYIDLISGKIKVRYYLEMNFENQGLFELNISFK